MGFTKAYGISPCRHLQLPVSLTQLTVCLLLTSLLQGLVVAIQTSFRALFRCHFLLEALLDLSVPTLSLSTTLTGLVLSDTSPLAFVFPAMIVGTCVSVPC